MGNIRFENMKTFRIFHGNIFTCFSFFVKLEHKADTQQHCKFTDIQAYSSFLPSVNQTLGIYIFLVVLKFSREREKFYDVKIQT